MGFFFCVQTALNFQKALNIIKGFFAQEMNLNWAFSHNRFPILPPFWKLLSGFSQPVS